MPASELDTLRQYLAFSSIRGPHPSVGGPLSNGLEVGGTEPPANVQRAFARHGELFQGKAVKVLSAAQDSTSKAGARYHTTTGQVPSEEVFRVLKFNHSRPIWSASVWSAMLECAITLLRERAKCCNVAARASAEVCCVYVRRARLCCVQARSLFIHS